MRAHKVVWKVTLANQGARLSLVLFEEALHRRHWQEDANVSRTCQTLPVWSGHRWRPACSQASVRLATGLDDAALGPTSQLAAVQPKRSSQSLLLLLTPLMTRHPDGSQSTGISVRTSDSSGALADRSVPRRVSSTVNLRRKGAQQLRLQLDSVRGLLRHHGSKRRSGRRLHRSSVPAAGMKLKSSATVATSTEGPRSPAPVGRRTAAPGGSTQTDTASWRRTGWSRQQSGRRRVLATEMRWEGSVEATPHPPH